MIELKIKQFQELYKIHKLDEVDEIEKAIHVYSILKNKDYDWVYENITTKEIIKFYSNTLNVRSLKNTPLFYVLNWKLRKINLDILERTLNENALILAYGANEESLISNLHFILAALTKRKNNNQEQFNKLALQIQQKVDVSIAYAVALFFLKKYNKENLLKDLTQRMESINLQLLKKLPSDIKS